MKILLPGSKFISAVNWITKVSDSRTPQLAAVVIRAEDETSLEARNWDVFASTDVALDGA